MKKIFLFLFLVVVVWFLPGAVMAQNRTATIYGFEKAEFVTGKVTISAFGDLVMVRDLKSTYNELLEFHLSKGFDRTKGVMIGQIVPGSSGNMSFDAPAEGIGEMDTVFFIVPGWSVPVAVGLLK